MKLSLVKADITTLAVDVIVNAANSSLLGGSGVDGAIHRAAGQGLYLECLNLGGCKTGQAKITGGYQLPCQKIIHTVGPVWQGGDHGEKELLTSCYRNSLNLAEKHHLQTIAFPCISTGIFKFPADLAAKIAVTTCLEFAPKSLDEVIFCCFSDSDLDVYKWMIGKID